MQILIHVRNEDCQPIAHSHMHDPSMYISIHIFAVIEYMHHLLLHGCYAAVTACKAIGHGATLDVVDVTGMLNVAIATVLFSE